MELGLKGKTALVVGASRGIGRATALELAREGCLVAAVARDEYELWSLCQEAGGAITAFAADAVTEASQVDMLIDVKSRMGVPHVIVHAVGGSAGMTSAFGSSRDYAKVWRINLGAAHDINAEFLPGMLERGWGRIVHMSSNAVKLGIGHVPYASAKHALEGYVRNFGKELAPRGIVMSAVRLGPIDNKTGWLYTQPAEWREAFFKSYVPMGRWGRPDEAVAAIAFLCSERATYMSGAVVDVDGGMR